MVTAATKAGASYKSPLGKAALDQLFLEARTFSNWLPQPVSDAEIKNIFDLVRMGPTSANSSPARFIWVKTPEAKEKLAACVNESNRSTIRTAPVVAIVAREANFHHHFDKLMAHAADKYRKHFAENDAARSETSLSGSTLQGAYLILAARALGFDCGPIGGFDREAVNAAFFDGTTISANFLCCIGHGDISSLMPRNGRFSFDDVNTIA
jgi:3-hydroxypropanoate dehydrogenase